MTYATLQADVASWLQRDDMTATIQTCVRYATAAFNRELAIDPVPEMESRDTRELTAEYSGLPADFLRMRAVVRDDGKELLYVTSQQMDEMEASGVSVEPQVYTMEDLQLRVYPAPTALSPVTVTISSYEKIPSLSAGSDTNWLLSSHPDLYLWGTLLQARAWLHDDARLKQVVEPAYTAGLLQLKRRVLTTPGMRSVLTHDIPAQRYAYDISRGY